MNVEEALWELKRIDAFPYADCRKLQDGDKRYGGLVPDLDFYLSGLAGYRSWGKGILNWSDEKIEEVNHSLRQSFFDRLPLYAELEKQITAENVPELHARLQRAERTRTLLRELLTNVKRERSAPTM